MAVEVSASVVNTKGHHGWGQVRFPNIMLIDRRIIAILGGSTNLSKLHTARTGTRTPRFPARWRDSRTVSLLTPVVRCVDGTMVSKDMSGCRKDKNTWEAFHLNTISLVMLRSKCVLCLNCGCRIYATRTCERIKRKS